MFAKTELISVAVTIGLSLALGLIAVMCAHNYVAGSPTSLYLAASVGALGGLAHEIAQSGGKILFFEKKDDGFYLGALSGMILGAVAGVLSARVLFTGKPPELSAAQLTYESLLAGVALKGVVEAAGGQAVSLGSTNPVQMRTLPPPPNQVPPD
jgi:hypothetical protein